MSNIWYSVALVIVGFCLCFGLVILFYFIIIFIIIFFILTIEMINLSTVFFQILTTIS